MDAERLAITSHLATGVRGRFSYGWAEGQPKSEPMNLADVRRVQAEWFGSKANHLLDLGICVRGPETPKPEVRRDAYLAEFGLARELGLPITMHAAQIRKMNSQAIRLLAEDSLLGPDLQLVHCINATPEDRVRMARSGTKLSISPLIEMQVGMGFPPERRPTPAPVFARQASPAAGPALRSGPHSRSLRR